MNISKISFLHKQWINKTCCSVQEQDMPHPAVQIYLWICFTLAAQMLEARMLFLLAAIVILLSIKISKMRFLTLLRRSRWILFSVFIIYAFTSSGDLLWPQLGVFSPVVEGVVEGFLQLSRLAIVLAGLSILLTLLSQSQLISGIYMLIRPLACLGLSRERVSVRLALTLRYAESVMQGTSRNWQDSVERQLAHIPVASEFIELYVATFSMRDGLLVVAASVVLLGVWL